MGKVESTYESEHTRFMREWMAKHPEEAKQQQLGRALWWDRPQKVEQQERQKDAAVPHKAYYYATES